MKFRTIIGIIAITACAISGSAETKRPAETSAHRRAHSHLAKSSTKMDMSSIGDFIKNDIDKRVAAEVEKNEETKAMLADLLTEARRHIGKPYRHGMKGPKAFDCSGFSSYVYKQFGYKISPSSRTQYTEGSKVDRKHLREGDLVFFTSRSSGRNVGHVGIVVSADNESGDFKFIHASIRGVKISSASEPYYSRRYVGARRIID